MRKFKPKQLSREEVVQNFKNINEVKRPVLYSFVGALIWSIFVILIIILFEAANDYKLSYNINLGSAFGMVIGAIWLCVKLGFLSKFFMNLKNARNLGIVKDIHEIKPSDVKMTLKEYEKKRKSMSWYGIITFEIIWIISFIITIAI